MKFTKTLTVLQIVAMIVTTTSLAFGQLTQALKTGVGTDLSGGVITVPPKLPVEPDDPFSKPRKPGPPILDQRTSTSIRFHWSDNSSYEQGYELYRGPGYSGPWTRLAVWGPWNTPSVPMSYTDSAVSRDTAYYYLVRAFNTYGDSTSIQTFATIDGRKVSRLQIRLRTADVSDAGTDDDVNVSLKDYTNGDTGTWLDYGRDDFERGDDFTYELLPTGISDLSDINDIYLLKPFGSDGWCIESLTLLADGKELYRQQFGSTSSTCLWLDNESGHERYFYIGRPTLRAHASWQSYQQPIPSLFILKPDLEKRVEGMVGDLIHDGVPVDSPVYWGTLDVNWTGDPLDFDRYVKVSRKDDQAVHVVFKLDVDTPGPGGLTAGLGFDLRFAGTCRTATTPAELRMTTENVTSSADFDFVTKALTFWLVTFGEDHIAAMVRESFPKFSLSTTIDNQQVSCVTPTVDFDGNISFQVTLARQTPGGRLNTFPGLGDANILTPKTTAGPTTAVVPGNIGTTKR